MDPLIIIDGVTWQRERNLPSGLFTENYIYKNPNQEIRVFKEPTSFMRKLLLLKENQVQRHIESAESNHVNYAQIQGFIAYMNSQEQQSWLTISQCACFSLRGLVSMLPNKRISENVAKYYTIQLINVLFNLREREVYYLSLRIEDLLLDANFNLRLSDYGIPNSVIKLNEVGEWLSLIPNRKTTFSPEILGHHHVYSLKSDMFNLGVIIFSLVTGFRPFTFPEIGDGYFRNIALNKWSNYWALVDRKVKLSNELKDLLFNLFTPNLDTRLDITQVMEHDWFRNGTVASYEEIQSLFTSINFKEEEILNNTIIPTNSSNTRKGMASDLIFKCEGDDEEIKSQLTKFCLNVQEHKQCKFKDFLFLNIHKGGILSFLANTENQKEECLLMIGEFFIKLGFSFEFNFDFILTIKFTKDHLELKQLIKQITNSSIDYSDFEFTNEMKSFEIAFYENEIESNKYVIVEFLSSSIESSDLDVLIEAFKKEATINN